MSLKFVGTLADGYLMHIEDEEVTRRIELPFLRVEPSKRYWAWVRYAIACVSRNIAR